MSKATIEHGSDPIYFLVLHLGQGGIEQFVITLANNFVKHHPVTVISVYKKSERPAEPLSKSVKVEYIFDFDIAKRKERSHIFSLAKHYTTRRRIIGRRIKQIQSGIIITTRSPHNSIVSHYATPHVLKIATEHNHLLDNPKYTQSVIRSCQGIDALVLPSREIFDFYQNHLENTDTSCVMIHHALSVLPAKTSSLETQNIISLGRLSPEKSFDTLIEVFKKVSRAEPNSNLAIYGEGQERDRLSNQICALGLQKRVLLPGFKDRAELNNILLNSSIFISTSLTESFGLAALEAMSYGIPVITFDSARGLLEFVEDNYNGRVIHDRNINAMSEAVIELLEDSSYRSKLGSSARETAKQYSPKQIISQWEDLFNLKAQKP